MAIPESQLETWAKQGATVTAKSTADSIKNALDSYDDWPDDADFEVFLQGSYKNNTNIRGDSDVDVVVQLNSTFRSNLTEEEKRLLGISEAYYKWQDFRNDVIKALCEYYGTTSIQEGRKSIKVSRSNGRLPADVVVCIEYRKYNSDLSKFYKGMTFWVPSESRWIINYPKSHYNNGVNKNQNTSLWYKRAVRMLKNSRGYISGDSTPSYFLECMIYNVPNSNDNHSSEVKATLKIFQNWARIKILLNTDQSSSQSKTASIIIDTPEGKYLSYQYINDPRPNAVKTMSIHRGTARLLFDEKKNSLEGEYYSGRDRQNFGSLYFVRQDAN